MSKLVTIMIPDGNGNEIALQVPDSLSGESAEALKGVLALYQEYKTQKANLATNVTPVTTAKANSMNIRYEDVLKILSTQFIFAEDVARSLTIGFNSGKNVIIYGPAGHAKSTMIECLIKGLGIEGKTFFQFFGEGMDEARLFGGLNFKKMNDEGILEYYADKSFLNYEVAVFEELFDAPPSVLLSLKDVLTARELRNGSQRVPMKTRVIICLTNKNPNEISDIGASAHALTERFPLTLELAWKKYDRDAYLAMFSKIEPRLKGPTVRNFKAFLAELCATITTEKSIFISPRTAVHALEVCQTAAALAGRSETTKNDIADLKFVPGFDRVAGEVIDAIMIKAQAETELTSVSKEFDVLKMEANKNIASGNVNVLAPIVKNLTALSQRINKIKFPDNLVQRRTQLSNDILTISNSLKEKMFEV